MKINQDLEVIRVDAIVEDVCQVANQTPVQVNEKAITANTTAQSQVETTGSTPFAKSETRPAEADGKEKDQKNGPLVEDNKHAKKGKGAFEFPDGGWECSKCQNYNFKGRKECNRCKKARSKQDLTGKPLHLLRPE